MRYYGEDQMDILMRKLSDYLNETLGVTLNCGPWDKQILPLYLQENFDYYKGKMYISDLLEKEVLFCVYLNSQTPATVEKMLRNVSPSPDVYPVLVQDDLPGYVRRRLVQKKVPFVAPGRQLYLPFVAIDFRERNANPKKGRNHFSALTQYVFLSMLMSPHIELTQSNLAMEFNCSISTASRVFGELMSFSSVAVKRNWIGEKLLVLNDRRGLWEEAQPFLMNPVRKKYYAKLPQNVELEEYVPAGESALAKISMLAEPRVPVFAYYRAKNEHGFSEEVLYPDEPGTVQIEAWRHPVPMLGDRINPLALILSLKNCKDDRVLIALDKVEASIW